MKGIKALFQKLLNLDPLGKKKCQRRLQYLIEHGLTIEIQNVGTESEKQVEEIDLMCGREYWYGSDMKVEVIRIEGHRKLRRGIPRGFIGIMTNGKLILRDGRPISSSKWLKQKGVKTQRRFIRW